MLIAAGNDGDAGEHSVGSPAVSKNCLSVGASESGPNRGTQDVSSVAYFSSKGPTQVTLFLPSVYNSHMIMCRMDD